MQTRFWRFWCGALGAGLTCAAVHAQTVVEAFEYASEDELLAAWSPSANAVVSLSEEVAPQSTGQKAMRVQFSFPSTAWATESVAGVDLAESVVIDPAQYITLRIKGDPAFAAADFRYFYVYAYDDSGNFGRWGTAVPTTASWQVLNFVANTIQAPWNSPGLPDFSRIIRFAFFQYGSETAIPAYTATIELDDLVIRDEPLTDIVPVTESVVEAFEYADDNALQAAWQPTANTVVSLTTDVALLSPGEKAMRAQFTFPSGEWATEVIRGPDLPAPVAIDPSQFVVVRIQGDPAFAAADFRDFYLYAYDVSGNFGRWGAPAPTTADWQIFNFPANTIQKPWDSPALPDLTKIVRFALYQYGSQAAIPPYTATLTVDDLMIRNAAVVEVPTTETVVETFEYENDEALIAVWTGSANAYQELSEDVAPKSPGQKSLKVTFNFPSIAWATEFVRSGVRATPVVIGPKQFVTLRIKGDPAFEAADFRNFYLYAYDASGNFGRWGTPVPTTSEWKVLNFLAGSIEKPWDSAALPDLANIVRFAFFQYGSQAAIAEYAAVVQVDDLMIRNTPLMEFPDPAPFRTLLDDFEGYADTTALEAFYTYQNSPEATATMGSLATPAPQGNKALALAIDFAGGQYPWGSVRSSFVQPFSFPSDAVVTVRFKGDPALATLADAATSFWLSFYDQAGTGMNFITSGTPIVSGEWTTLQATLADFGDTTTIDVGNLVQWRLLVQAYQGTADHAPISATFHLDDLRLSIQPSQPPTLAIARDGNVLKITASGLVSGKSYELRSSTDLKQWAAGQRLTATGTTATWTVQPSKSAEYFRLAE